jgi:hypothetical protein
MMVAPSCRSSRRRLNQLRNHLLLQIPAAANTDKWTAFIPNEPLMVAPKDADAVDLSFWEREGYVIVRNAVAPHDCQRVVDDIWRQAGKSATDRETWYRRMPRDATRSGTRSPVQLSWQADLEAHMVNGPLHSQAAWDVRSSERIHRAFAQLWGTPKLLVHVAGYNLKPPVSFLHPGWGGGTYLHWDADISDIEGPPQIQGVLYLADTAIDGGGAYFPRS